MYTKYTKNEDLPVIEYDKKTPFGIFDYTIVVFLVAYICLIGWVIFTPNTAEAYMFDYYTQTPSGSGTYGSVSVQMDLSGGDDGFLQAPNYIEYCDNKMGVGMWSPYVTAWTVDAWNYLEDPIFFSATFSNQFITSTVSGFNGDIMYVGFGCATQIEPLDYDEYLGGYYWTYTQDVYHLLPADPAEKAILFSIDANIVSFSFAGTGKYPTQVATAVSSTLGSFSPLIAVVAGIAMAIVLVPIMVYWFRSGVVVRKKQ